MLRAPSAYNAALSQLPRVRRGRKITDMHPHKILFAVGLSAFAVGMRLDFYPALVLPRRQSRTLPATAAVPPLTSFNRQPERRKSPTGVARP